MAKNKGMWDSDYVHGAYDVMCDTCGFKYKNFQVRLDWQNLLVCEKCYDPKPPEYDHPYTYPATEGKTPDDAENIDTYEYEDKDYFNTIH